MKRFFFALALILLPAALHAQIVDRDVLLVPDGTLYTIESTADANGEARHLLRLTIQRDKRTVSTYVPESFNGDYNVRPALAYDNESNTLFVFWLDMPNGMSSKLLVATYHDSAWQPALSFDDAAFHMRFNLRIGVTRHVAKLQQDGSFSDVPTLLVHAVWWESLTSGDEARYALFTVNNSKLELLEVHDLAEFTEDPAVPFEVRPDFNPEILRHPAIIEGSDSVDVVYGNASANSMNRVTLKPVMDVRIHIPVGRKPGRPFAPPATFSANWTGRISTIVSGDNVVLYNTGKDTTGYVMYTNGAWSDVRNLPLSSDFSADAAAAAITRMVNSQ